MSDSKILSYQSKKSGDRTLCWFRPNSQLGQDIKKITIAVGPNLFQMVTKNNQFFN